MSPEPGVVGAVVGVEHVRAGGDERAGDGGALLHGAAELLIRLAGERALIEAAHLARDGVAHADREVLAAGALYLLDDLGGEAEPVFKASAVSVEPVVGVGDGELVEEVSLVDRVYLDAVHAGLLADERGSAVGLDDVLDLVEGEASVLHGGLPDIRKVVARGDGDLVPELGVELGHGEHGAAEAGAELHEVLRAVGVDFIHELGYRPAENVLGLFEAAAVAPLDDAGDARDDEADVALAALEVEGTDLLDKAHLMHVDGGGAAHRDHRDAVFQLDAADAERGE